MIMCIPIEYQGVEPITVIIPAPAEDVVVESLWLGVVEDDE